MRKDTRRFAALIMVICMLACMMPEFDVRAESAASYTGEVDVTLYKGQLVTVEVDAETTGGENDTETATAVIDSTSTHTYDATTGGDSDLDDTYVNLESALYTFTGDSTDGWVISNTTSDGATVYANIDNSSNGYPNNTASDTLTLTYYSDGFTITNGSGRNLAFLDKTYTNLYTFDEGNSGVNSTGVYQFYIYRQAAGGETCDEISGYVRVTSLDDISSGGQYLIAAYRDGNYYVLYPSVSTSNMYYHAAKVLGTVKTTYDMTVTGVTAGTTSVSVGDTLYSITVLDAQGYGTVSLAGGEAKELKITDFDRGFSLASGSTVVWTVEDTDVAGLYDTSEDGTVTSLIAHSRGETNVIARVYDSGGSLTATYVWTVTVTSTSGSGSYSFTWNVTETVYNGTLYYSVDGGELVQATPVSETTDSDGNTIRYYEVSCTAYNVSSTGFIYFIKPDEGYIVTAVQTTGKTTYDQFYGTTSVKGYYDKAAFQADYNVTHSGNWPTDYVMTDAEWDALISQAIAAGCEAVYWNTRNIAKNGSDSFSYTNYCDKLPTVDKVITSLTRTVSGQTETIPYVEGETEVLVDDVINYTVTVTTYKETADIEYTDVILTDKMTSGSGNKAVFTDNNGTTYDVTGDVNYVATQSDAEKVAVALTVTYTVTANDQDSELLNTVELKYNYDTEYSTGTYGGTASAVASVNLSTFTPDDIVIDFGLPVTIDYSSDRPSSGNGAIASGTATYGTVTVEDNKVTYTPHSVLTEADTVTLVSAAGATATFQVYPATTVYYEEGFAAYGSGWNVDTAAANGWNTATNKGTTEQQAQVAKNRSSYTSTGTDASDYNYDAAYVNDTAGSEGTAAKTTTVADSLSFTFTGTGVDIFANCDSGSGMVAIRIADASGVVYKLLFVDMQNTGTYSISDGTTAYNTPIASVSDLTYGSYTVTIYLVTSGSGTGIDSGFRFDGFRVYNTIAQSKDASTKAYTVQTEVYQADDEDYPDYYELRDYVLAGLNVAIASDSDTVYASDIAASTTSQVYASGSTAGAVVYYDAASAVKDNGDAETDNVQTLLDDGPKNELYLYHGMTVVFKINTNREVQIGLRSVTGASVSYSITAVTSGGSTTSTNYTISSTMDMFYTLQEKGVSGEVTYTITVSGSNSGILSVTDIKVCDCPEETVLGELTEEDLTEALVSVGYAADEEDLTGALLSAGCAADEEELTEALSSVDEDADEEDLTEALTSVDEDANEEDLTEALTSVDKDTDEEEVTSVGVSLTAEAKAEEASARAASLEVNLNDYTGTVLATTTLAKNGAEGEETAFAASDILTAASGVLPEGYALANADDIADQTAVYGESSSMNLQIGRVATLTVNCVNYSGTRASTVATITLTKVQTGPGRTAVFTAGEIRAAIPADCRVLLTASASVNYGMSASKTIICY